MRNTDPERSPRTRRRFLAGVAGVGAGAIAGCFGGSDGGNPDPTPGPSSDAVATAPIPSDPSSYTYATMGTSDSATTATYFGNWKCPYCAEFSGGFLGTIVTDYVEPGDIALEFRGLAYANGEPFLGEDAPNAARAGLAVWNTDPESYWAFHEYVMANQPPESERWATPDRLAEMATEADVSDVEPVRSAAAGSEYAEAVDRTSSAAQDAGVRSTPSLQVGTTVVNPLNQSEARQAIEDAL